MSLAETIEDLPSARDWVRVLAQYREPNQVRSTLELCASLLPLLTLWAASWWLLSVSIWLPLIVSMFNGAFLVRLFIIQHDCGHGGLFNNKRIGDWIGRCIGVLTLTPYDVWQKTHAIHHAASGNLDQRGIGDVYTMTVAEYQALSGWRQLQYRFYRHPLFLFGFVPTYLFVLQNRLPLGLTRSGKKYWISAMGTNAALIGLISGITYFGGLVTLFAVFVPTVIVAATLGMWLFYVQHQFEDTHWSAGADWQVHDAALHGSSHYILPPVLQWFSGNIGIHHVHHLYSRIPFYRLTEVIRDNPELAEAQHLTIRESLACVRLKLWDEAQHKLVSFKEAERLRVVT
jgi:omega-6 fatty acid desaturase (delta-12 desaturase)